MTERVRTGQGQHIGGVTNAGSHTRGRRGEKTIIPRKCLSLFSPSTKAWRAKAETKNRNFNKFTPLEKTVLTCLTWHPFPLEGSEGGGAETRASLAGVRRLSRRR